MSTKSWEPTPASVPIQTGPAVPDRQAQSRLRHSALWVRLASSPPSRDERTRPSPALASAGDGLRQRADRRSVRAWQLRSRWPELSTINCNASSQQAWQRVRVPHVNRAWRNPRPTLVAYGAPATVHVGSRDVAVQVMPARGERERPAILSPRTAVTATASPRAPGFAQDAGSRIGSSFQHLDERHRHRRRNQGSGGSVSAECTCRCTGVETAVAYSPHSSNTPCRFEWLS